ncbi:MAG: helix-turn-helix domain-containing protein [Lachnospiraceae bacterium]|nr:helix-turn-helix domain-containing protein [Lachnospiraceae bacterium]
MNLAEKIITLRTNHNMSQGDLAEKLNVSRQSVSKWETGASIPDLEKLIAMSELFQITLDELVKGDAEGGPDAEQNTNSNLCSDGCPPPQVIYVQTPVENTNTSSTQRTVGFILLVTGILCILLEFLVPADGILAFLGVSSILCSIVCLIAKKNPGLKIAWAVEIFMFIFTFPRGIFMNTGLFTIAGLLTLGTWLFLPILIFITIKKKRKGK